MFLGSNGARAGLASIVALALGGLAAGGLFTGCGGTITFADDPDAFVGGSGDAGVVANPDATVVVQQDAGCIARTRPTPPTTWPYPVTAQAYLTHFANTIPAGAITCNSTACHGSGTQAPYMPADAALSDPAVVMRVTSELWLRARPPVSGPPLLRRKHDPLGDNATLAFTPAQVAAIQAFLDRAYDCAWKSAPAPGPGECPAPDTSYCDQ